MVDIKATTGCVHSTGKQKPESNFTCIIWTLIKTGIGLSICICTLFQTSLNLLSYWNTHPSWIPETLHQIP